MEMYRLFLGLLLLSVFLVIQVFAADYFSDTEHWIVSPTKVGSLTR